jgi:hypothetical protein
MKLECSKSPFVAPIWLPDGSETSRDPRSKKPRQSGVSRVFGCSQKSLCRLNAGAAAKPSTERRAGAFGCSVGGGHMKKPRRSGLSWSLRGACRLTTEPSIRGSINDTGSSIGGKPPMKPQAASLGSLSNIDRSRSDHVIVLGVVSTSAQCALGLRRALLSAILGL